jgi:hypothetical protein
MLALPRAAAVPAKIPVSAKMSATHAGQHQDNGCASMTKVGKWAIMGRPTKQSDEGRYAPGKGRACFSLPTLFVPANALSVRRARRARRVFGQALSAAAPFPDVGRAETGGGASLGAPASRPVGATRRLAPRRRQRGRACLAANLLCSRQRPRRALEGRGGGFRAGARLPPAPFLRNQGRGRQGRASDCVARLFQRRGNSANSPQAATRAIALRPQKRPRLPFSANVLFFPAKRPRRRRKGYPLAGQSTTLA